MDTIIKLKEARKNKGFTQKQVSEFLEISERSYQRYESGAHEFNFKTLIKLADYFDVSTDYLLGRTDNPNSHKL